ncbi:NAD(P)/FAD-dependent oxidoreductase [Sphingomonas sp. ABOLE]|uniref:NAD(P)/FAD-dependent oxidoreductase n=1 Tax=Sphingomonas sp. ABOLE TaxID=1985878 RepID=UPI000F7EE547|nr:NAD(P)/FAD-dependent oxidoreductase [Sphingomonas sp. ABOLE]RSV37251.1 NAD(P)/FAD-dependent oxidoreductase [Sphingomonas sp. ABOLE]
MYDVIVIGGSFAGHAAALQLARARQDVLLIDAGTPRNRFADASHGFLCQDGRAPHAILQEAARQLLAYPTAEIVQAEALRAEKLAGGFVVPLANGSDRRAKRLVLATGVTDTLPELPGMAERWGATVLHCPYCHGYEVRDRPLGIIANHPMSAHQAALIPDWGPATFFTQGMYEPDAEQAALLARRGVSIERSPVVALLGDAPALAGVQLEDGRVLPMEAVFTAPRTHPTSAIASELGCAMEEGPSGPFLTVDAWGATSVEGVYAAGDATSPMHNATLAAASGVLAGVGAHQSLMRS